MTLSLKTLSLAAATFVFSNNFWGQVTITQPYATAEEYVQEILLGDGVTATNITYTGSLAQLGLLENGAGVFSVASGLMLNTDDATCEGFCADCLGGAVADADLLSVANSVPPLINQSFTVSSVNDVCILEFDFEAGGDSISFNYVFGSDEYLNYVNTTYNDIFAFFLSGPGITGPYASPAGFPDGAINIAQVPESDPQLPITISSVNNVTNSAYYIDNPGADFGTGPYDICVNGFTSTFTAEAAVQCGETYHIKLAIADGSDASLESFVVLEAGSFSAGSVDLNADAVPLAADGLQNIVPYDEAVGLPDVFTYENGESFPYTAWSDDNTILVEVDGENVQVDAVVIEGCNDAQFTVVRPEIEIDLLDTLYLGLEGSAILGLDYNESFNEVIMYPGQTESDITLGVKDDGFDEGVETVEITFEYVNGCGETVITSSRVVILDALPVEAVPSAVSCLDDEGNQTLGYDDISGYGPFRFVWDGNVWNNAWADPADWVTSFDSLFSMTNGEGQLISSHNIELTVIDQCNKTFEFEQIVYHPVITETEICFDDRQDFPMFNSGIPVTDLLLNGQSVIENDLLSDTLLIDITLVGTTEDDEDLWRLNAIESGSYGWERVLTMVDSCGFETDALIRVRDCEIPNVFTPNNDSQNDNFRIRGLDGLMGSRLVIYNRYGTVVFEDETADDAEFELVWNGRFANGNPAPEGTYQWVLIRPDGIKDQGPLTLIRQR